MISVQTARSLKTTITRIVKSFPKNLYPSIYVDMRRGSSIVTSPDVQVRSQKKRGERHKYRRRVCFFPFPKGVRLAWARGFLVRGPLPRDMPSQLSASAVFHRDLEVVKAPKTVTSYIGRMS
ncbi:hypothetical protein CEXT_503911 [Caerostris extrusa]|uniref:Uncharacterized protein n=1 Tax=Caerostris extrusa TaxID=172846 RepID=A0AAV4PT20_CAEEX|nr:hypothetical protein CEXT_503911 [Caerostris extrusa]